VRCKHENADHLMPGETFVSSSWAGENYTVHVEQFRCIDCGAWLSLGESDDAPDAVRVEMRAAELAAMLPDSFDETMMEWAGRRHFVEGHEMPTTFGSMAGWLAAAIATHAPQPADAGGKENP
jgi:hypothetical protein